MALKDPEQHKGRTRKKRLVDDEEPTDEPIDFLGSGRIQPYHEGSQAPEGDDSEHSRGCQGAKGRNLRLTPPQDPDQKHQDRHRQGQYAGPEPRHLRLAMWRRL